MVHIQKERLLHDKGLRKAIAKGHIKITPAPEDSQFQPATLDTRIGKVRVYSSLQPSELNPDPARQLIATYDGNKGERIVIPKDSVADIFLHEKLDIANYELSGHPRYFMSFESRSSRGRLHLEPGRRLFEEEGRHYVSMRNNSQNDVVLYAQEPFGQVFFHPMMEKDSDGEIVTDPAVAQRLAKKILKGKFTMDGAAIKFTPKGRVLKIKKIGEIDTRKKYEQGELYEEGDLPNHVDEGNPCIVKLEPRVELPSNVGIRLLPRNPESGEANVNRRSVCAGWVDPGYSGTITAHPVRKGFVQANDPIAYGVFYLYKTPVGRPYGSKPLRSHYQRSKGTGIRS